MTSSQIVTSSRSSPGRAACRTVFRAHDRVLERTVAVKVLHQRYNDEDEYVERFRREARMAAGLSHPNIVTVIDRGEHEGRQFIVFEYVDGDNLKEVVNRAGPLPVERVLALGIQIASGLAFAHANGLVHRDVKPQNVLLNGDGTAKVTDFGIARSLDVGKGVTQTGTVLGTSDYIAPEQAQGQPVGERTDVYSLGVVLYELLTGELPFAGDNFVAVAMKHINEAAPRVSDAPARRAAAARRRDRGRAREGPGRALRAMDDFRRELQACLAEVQRRHGRAAPTSTRRRSCCAPPPKQPRRAAPADRPLVRAARRARARAARRPSAGSRTTRCEPERRLRRQRHDGGGDGERSRSRASAPTIPTPGDGGSTTPTRRTRPTASRRTYWPTESYYDPPSFAASRASGSCSTPGSTAASTAST